MYTPTRLIDPCMAPTDDLTCQYLKDFTLASVSYPIVGQSSGFVTLSHTQPTKLTKTARRYMFLFADAAEFTRARTCNQEQNRFVHMCTEVHTTRLARFMCIAVCLNSHSVFSHLSGYIRIRGRLETVYSPFHYLFSCFSPGRDRPRCLSNSSSCNSPFFTSRNVNGECRFCY